MSPHIIFNFSGALLDEGLPQLLTVEGEEVKVLDCRELEGTNCYCDAEALETLKGLLNGFASVCWLDSGDYHYISKLRSDCVAEPFSLVLIDHHPDMQAPAFGGILSCGGWLRDVLESNPFLEKVLIIGIAPNLLSETKGWPKKVMVVTEDDLGPTQAVTSVQDTSVQNSEKVSLPKFLSECMRGRKVFLSIDKDALTHDEARTDWDQGSMTLEWLSEFLCSLGSCCEILGVDICGTLPVSKGAKEEDFRVNALTDIALTRVLRKILAP